MNLFPVQRRNVPENLRFGFPLAASMLAALVIMTFYVALVADTRLIPFARLLAVFPVLLSSYRRRDWWPGIAYTVFFASAFIWQAYWAVTGHDPNADVPGAFTASILLLGLSLVTYSMAGIRGARETLAEEARARGELLERTTSLDRVASFVCEEAKFELSAEDAGLLVRNPVDDRWELYSVDRVVAPASSQGHGSLRLASWLADRNEEVVVGDLWTDSRFEGGGAFRSLLARPLRGPDRRLLAFLVLTHTLPGMFGPEHFTSLSRLAGAAGPRWDMRASTNARAGLPSAWRHSWQRSSRLLGS